MHKMHEFSKAQSHCVHCFSRQAWRALHSVLASCRRGRIGCRSYNVDTFSGDARCRFGHHALACSTIISNGLKERIDTRYWATEKAKATLTHSLTRPRPNTKWQEWQDVTKLILFSYVKRSSVSKCSRSHSAAGWPACFGGSNEWDVSHVQLWRIRVQRVHIMTTS